MRTRSILSVLLLAAVCIVVVLACQLPFARGMTSDLKITIGGGERSRTILPASYPAPVTYDLQLTATGQTPVSLTNQAGPTIVVPQLAITTWTVSVNGKDSGGNVIVQGSTSVTMEPRGTNAVSISLSYINTGTGTGKINVTLDWTASGSVIDSVALSLTDPSGTVTTPAVAVIGSTAAFSNASAAVGSYLAVFRFKHGSAVVSIRSESIVVFQNVSTTATITLTSSDIYEIATNSLIINEVGNPYYTNFAIAIELHNTSSLPTILSNYRLRTYSRINDGSSYPANGIATFTLPSVSIPGGGYAVIRGKAYSDYVSGGATVYLDNGASNNPAYPWDGYSAGFVELLDTGGNTLDFVRWGSDTDTPTSSSFAFTGTAPAFSNGSAYIGYSLNRDINSTDTHAASDWTIHAWMTLGGPNDVTTDTASDGDGIPDSAKAVNGTFAGLPIGVNLRT